MMPALVNKVAPMPPPAYHYAQAYHGPALHIDALTLVNTLYLLTTLVALVSSARPNVSSLMCGRV